jgi:putative transposase
MRIRKQGHCAYQCEYHLVIVSKYRRKIFNLGSFAYFKEVTKTIRESIPEVEILTMNHDVDHIHLHLSIPPKMKVSDVLCAQLSRSVVVS